MLTVFTARVFSFADFCQSLSLPPGGLLVNCPGKLSRKPRPKMLQEPQLLQLAGDPVEIR